MIRRRPLLCCSYLLLFGCCPGPTLLHAGEADDAETSGSASRMLEIPANRLLPAEVPAVSSAEAKTRPDYRNVIRQSLRFLLLEQSFRYATEEGARHTHTSFLGGYTSSITNLHGWADGDPFIVNYVGHPMEGAVAGRIWIQNDGDYRYVRFGKDRDYWRSRLRAAAFAFLYSVQFEIGPVSEASIGATQKYFPQQGFVDHVVTPAIGLAWILAEDALDKYFIEWVESRTTNPWYKLLIRGGLNPGRSLANVLAVEVPWHRQTRPDLFGWSPFEPVKRPAPHVLEARQTKGPAPFELTFAPLAVAPLGTNTSDACIGGGAEAAARMSTDTQLVVSVGGCKLTGLPANTSGDMLLFMAGPRFTASVGRWVPHAQLLVGGLKVTSEEMYPSVKAALAASLAEQGRMLDFTDHNRYTRHSEATGFAVSVGSGLSRKLNDALEWQVASVEYTHGWAGNLERLSYRHLFQVKSGLTLRMGTW